MLSSSRRGACGPSGSHQKGRRPRGLPQTGTDHRCLRSDRSKVKRFLWPISGHGRAPLPECRLCLSDKISFPIDERGIDSLDSGVHEAFRPEKKHTLENTPQQRRHMVDCFYLRPCHPPSPLEAIPLNETSPRT